MFEWFYELFVQFVTMVLSWFGMDAKALLGDKEQAPSGEESSESIAQNVAQVLNEGEQ
jgi:hypothetical protein